MKKKKISITTVLMVMVLLSINILSCKKNSTEPSMVKCGDMMYILQTPSSNASHNFKVYTINADGSDNKQVISSDLGFNMPRWSPDLTKLAVLVYTGYNTSIYVYNANGEAPVRLTTTSNVVDILHRWSPNGDRLTFTRILPNQNDRNEIWTMNSDGSNQQMILEGFSSTWSNDGIKLIYASNKSGNFDLYVSNADGTNELKLTNSTMDDANPNLSPDGTRILYTVSNGVRRGSESSTEIWVMNTDGTNQLQLTNNNFSDSNPEWSPGGTQLLFCSDRSATDHYEVYTMNPDGTNVVRVTNTSGSSTAIYPSWTPIVE